MPCVGDGKRPVVGERNANEKVVAKPNRLADPNA